MRKAIKITLIGLLLLVLDLGLTAFFLNRYENLVSEGNIFFEYGNGLWALGLNGIHLIGIFACAYCYGTFKTIRTTSKNAFDYAKQLYLHENMKFILIIGCFTFIVASFVSRIAVIIDWLIFGIYTYDFYNTTYSMIKSAMPMERFDVIIAFITVFLSIPLWFRLEFRKSKKYFPNI
jgi:hypothetical protein